MKSQGLEKFREIKTRVRAAEEMWMKLEKTVHEQMKIDFDEFTEEFPELKIISESNLLETLKDSIDKRIIFSARRRLLNQGGLQVLLFCFQKRLDAITSDDEKLEAIRLSSEIHKIEGLLAKSHGNFSELVENFRLFQEIEDYFDKIDIEIQGVEKEDARVTEDIRLRQSITSNQRTQAAIAARMEHTRQVRWREFCDFLDLMWPKLRLMQNTCLLEVSDLYQQTKILSVKPTATRSVLDYVFTNLVSEFHLFEEEFANFTKRITNENSSKMSNEDDRLRIRIVQGIQYFRHRQIRQERFTRFGKNDLFFLKDAATVEEENFPNLKKEYVQLLVDLRETLNQVKVGAFERLLRNCVFDDRQPSYRDWLIQNKDKIQKTFIEVLILGLNANVEKTDRLWRTSIYVVRILQKITNFVSTAVEVLKVPEKKLLQDKVRDLLHGMICPRQEELFKLMSRLTDSGFVEFTNDFESHDGDLELIDTLEDFIDHERYLMNWRVFTERPDNYLSDSIVKNFDAENILTFDSLLILSGVLLLAKSQEFRYCLLLEIYEFSKLSKEAQTQKIANLEEKKIFSEIKFPEFDEVTYYENHRRLYRLEKERKY